MSKFPLVQLSPGRELNGRVSQTMLRHYQACPRSGYFYSEFKGEASTSALARGSAGHKVFELGIAEMIARDVTYVPPEVVKSIVDEQLARYNVPFEEHDYLREMAFRWGGEFSIDPASVVCVESLIVLPIGGYDVRMKIDYAALLEDATAVEVLDWKTARGAPAYEEIARVRPDGTRAAKNFQLILYALGLAYGKPVRVEVGPHGERVEVVEEFGLLPPSVSRFDLAFVYPGIEGKDGLMLRRDVSLTLLELAEYRVSMEGLMERLARSEASGDWPAVESDSACTECPARALCPIPDALRDHRGEINSMEQASEAAARWSRQLATWDSIRKELKAFSVANGNAMIPFGADKAWDWGYQESERIRDKDAFMAAVDEAVQFGTPFDRSKYVQTVKSTPFKVRTLSAEELADEEESDGGSSDGGAAGGDDGGGAGAS